MSLGPLTTLFIPQLDCLDQDVQFVYSIADNNSYYLTAGPGTATCFPSGQQPNLTNYYSPGRCPQGYTTACSHVDIHTRVSSTETIATCCPSVFSFGCATDTAGPNWGVLAQCTTTTSAFVISALDALDMPSYVFSSSASTNSDGNVILESPIINGWGLQIRWQSTDEALLGLTSSTSTITLDESTAPTLSTPTSIPTSTTPPAEPAVTLTAGATAGICIGAIVGTVLLVGSVWRLFLVKRRQRRQQTLAAPEERSNTDQGKSEQANDQQAQLYHNAQPQLSGVSVAGTSAGQELPASLPDARNMAELSATKFPSPPSELQG
ncbi:hypothetical protein F4818DRAFT_451529 [Hypoxylon cercidicola]|nr:hypothetical protein F4818DRAFT_451529 [Hypoxylon cercidicola]